MLIVWHAFCYTAASDKSDAIEGVPDQLLKGAAMMFKVYSRHDELLLFTVNDDYQFWVNFV